MSDTGLAPACHGLAEVAGAVLAMVLDGWLFRTPDHTGKIAVRAAKAA